MIESIRGRFPACRRTEERGFSLVELIVVMALLVLVVLVGMPAMQDWLERYRVRTAAQNLAADLQLQRMRAVSRNREFSISFDQTNRTYTLFDGDPINGWVQIDPAANLLPMGVTFTIVSGDPIDLVWSGQNDVAVFHPDGSVNDQLAQDNAVTLTNALGEAYQVVINQVTGRVQVVVVP